MKSRDQRIFLEALDELEKEKGILKEELFETIENHCFKQWFSFAL